MRVLKAFAIACAFFACADAITDGTIKAIAPGSFHDFFVFIAIIVAVYFGLLEIVRFFGQGNG